MAPAIPYVLMATQVVGAISQGNAAAARENASAQASLYNAQVSRQQADQALKVSTADQIAQQRKTAQMLGVARASIAQSGLGFTGSNADVLDRSATLSELDQLNIAYEGATRARGYLAQSDLDEFQARIASENATSARRAGLVGAATAVGKIGFDYLGWGKTADATTAKSIVPSSMGLRPGGGVGLVVGGRRFV